MQSLVMSFPQGIFNVEDESYLGRLGKGCPMLRNLSVLSHHDFYEEWDPPSEIKDGFWSAAIVDVLTTKCESLKEFRMDVPLLTIIGEVRAALRSCQNILKCEVPFNCLSAVKNMSQLHSLTINWFYFTSDEDLVAVESFLKSCDEMTSIKELSCRGFGIETPERSMSECDNRRADSLLLLMDRCRRVEAFHVSMVKFGDNFLSTVLTKMQSLQKLRLESCCGLEKEDIEQLRESGEMLRSVEIIDLQVDEVWEKDSIHCAVENLKKARPSLSVEVTCSVWAYPDPDAYQGAYRSRNSDYDERGHDAYMASFGGNLSDDSYQNKRADTYDDFCRSSYRDDY